MSIHEHHAIVILCDECQEASDRDDFPSVAVALRWHRKQGWVITNDGKHICDWCKPLDAELPEDIGTKKSDV